MRVSKLFIENFRVISSVSVEVDPEINIFVGDNGAGKSSVLEAIHFLSLGRSFRSGRTGSIISHGEPFLTVGARLAPFLEKVGPQSMGIRADNKHALYKLDRERIRSISHMSEVLPVIAYEPSTTNSVITESSDRRKILDWGCFQASPKFVDNWRSYRRALTQRNSLLKTRAQISTISSWDAELAPLAERVSTARKEYLEILAEEFKLLVQELSLSLDVTLDFKKGWKDGIPLLQQFRQGIDTDLRRGFTQYGSQRDDLVIRLNSHPIVSEGSRGQTKVVVLLLKLAQASLLEKQFSKKSILLLDDLPSELDEKYLADILRLVGGLKTQVFLSSVNLGWESAFTKNSLKVFHVKHGVIKETVCST